MKGRESIKPEKPDYAEIARMFGEGRLSVAKKQAYLERYGERLHGHADFVSMDTYRAALERFNLEGKTIVDVGAGYSINPNNKEQPLNPFVAALGEINARTTLIPIDYDHDRTESWLLLETNDPKKNNLVVLNPVTADAINLPFSDATIDGYASANLINEPRTDVDSQKKFIQSALLEAHRILKTGGFLIISSFGYFWWKEKGQILYNDGIKPEEIVPKDSILDIVHRVGFTDVTELELDVNATEKFKKLIHLERVKGALPENEIENSVGIQEACAFVAIKP